MSQHAPQIELKQTKCYDSEDLAQDCSAYLKTKLFMAKRIAQQQSEIESLKGQLLLMTLKHSEMFEMIKYLNEQIRSCENSTIKPMMMLDNDERIDLSGEMINSIVIEDNIASNHFTRPQDKVTQNLKNENLELTKQLMNAQVKEKENSLVISKMVYDKYILFSELNELITSLTKVDSNLLNEFYLNNLNKKHKDALSSMGIKYNILSAQSQLLLLNGSEDSLESKKLINENSKNMDNIFNQNDCNYVNIEKYVGVIRHYEKELNSKAIKGYGYSFAAKSASTNIQEAEN